MKKKNEKPVPFMVRLYKKQRSALTKAARKGKVSEAEIIRHAIGVYLHLSV